MSPFGINQPHSMPQTSAQRRENIQHSREQRTKYKEGLTPDARQRMESYERNQFIDKVTLSGDHSCHTPQARIGRALVRGAVNIANPMQAIGMLSRGSSMLATEMGASPKVVRGLDAAARHQESFNAGINKTIDAVH